MDNVTHTLAGLLLAEAAGQLRRRGTREAPSEAFRVAAAVAGAVAANLPDADLFYQRLVDPSPLGYLLQHRGYTHTVPLAVLGALATWAATLALWRRAVPRRGWVLPTADDRRWLLALLAVAVLVAHLGLDYTNSYGIHPFWPVNNRWYYGDAVFIIEPWLWVAAVPALILAARRPVWRVVAGGLLVAVLALAWTGPFVGRTTAAALTVGAALSTAAALRLRPAARAATAVAGWVVVEALFFAATHTARQTLVAAADPTARLLDVAITPAVANPLCATALVVEATAGGAYRVRTATAAALPAILPAARCTGDGRGATATVGMQPATASGTPAVRWDAEWAAPLAELVALGRDNCQAAALLRFARVPVWRRTGRDSLVVSDLRFDRGGRGGFATLTVADRPTTCPARVPPWRPPRADVVGGQ